MYYVYRDLDGRGVDNDKSSTRPREANPAADLSRRPAPPCYAPSGNILLYYAIVHYTVLNYIIMYVRCNTKTTLLRAPCRRS